MSLPWSLTTFTRISFFLVYFWFGLLKIIHISPATELVVLLHDATIPWFGTGTWFTSFFGFFECFLALLFLFPSKTKVTVILFIAHMATTFLPLFLLPKITWNGIGLSLVGQYIVKNLILIAAGLHIYKDYFKKYG